MNLKEQHYVCELAACQNITKAAEKLHISQPALSSYLTNLEAALDTRLFDRIDKRLVLTFAGERYVEKARQMIRLEADFDAELSDIVKNHRGRVRLGIQIRRSPYIIPSLVMAFRSEYPNIEMVIHEGNTRTLSSLLQNDELDLIISNYAVTKPDMEYIKIYNDLVLLAVSVEHPLAKQGKWLPGCNYPWLDVSKIEDEPLVLNQPGQTLRATADRIMEERHIVPKNVFAIRNIETAIRLVGENVGIGFVVESYAKNLRFIKKAAYFAIGDPLYNIDLMVSHRKGFVLTQYMLRLIEILKEII